MEELDFPINNSDFEDRVEEIKKAIDDAADKMGEKIKYRALASYSIKCAYYLALSKYNPVCKSVALSASGALILAVYRGFVDVIVKVNEYTTFVPTKQDFCDFWGIDAVIYGELLINGTEEQRLSMGKVENFLVGIGYESAQNGISKESTTKMRMKARGTGGHGIVESTPVDSIICGSDGAISEIEFMRRLNAICAQKNK